MKIGIKISGRETLQNFDRLAAEIRANVLEQAVAAGATPILRRSQELTPLATGHLKRSIGIATVSEGSKATAHIGTDVDYASFVEYGTGIVGRSNPHSNLPVEGVPITGSWIYDYKNQNWTGGPARSFLRGGFDSAYKEAISTIAREFAAGVAREAGKR